ncbi:LOW QUALITY PROTEIN: uncharacterized protein K02A2.6-like [Protopterus annectens]|uniref:LOW QUALITY PROTEIN: uncharacterized protein K02A2.6-like n=1 Tax=Protopterus annectens TaxID=7888 RepID=UPI001CF939F5|nr:LOW QUALITY PROTEIN: uncharacterized protein K02A2.6-like [Protopterus annectens]
MRASGKEIGCMREDLQQSGMAVKEAAEERTRNIEAHSRYLARLPHECEPFGLLIYEDITYWRRGNGRTQSPLRVTTAGEFFFSEDGGVQLMSDDEETVAAGVMAVSMLGSLVAYDCQTQTWEEFCEVLEHFFEANQITDAGRKRAILLSSVGSKTYSLMRNLLSPDKPGDKSFTELTSLLQSHYNPKPSEIVQRFKFNSRTRVANETVTEYVAVLRELAQHCNYGDRLTEMLRDRLVCGIADDRIQRRLLAEPELSFEKALKLAQAIETANKDIRDLQPRTIEGVGSRSATPLPVHKVVMEHKQQGKSGQFSCYRCGGEHLSRNCRFLNEKCHACGKKGHVKKMCRSTPSRDQQRKGEKKSSIKDRKGNREIKQQYAHHMREAVDQQTSEEEEVFTMLNMKESRMERVDPITAQLDLNGKMVHFEVDTGCSVTVLSKAEYGKLWQENEAPELQDCSVTLKTYTGEKVPTLGMAKVTVTHKDKVKQLPVMVVAGSGPNLLGQAWLKELEMGCLQLHKIEQHLLTLQDVLENNEEVFKEELGTWRGPPAKIHVKENATPRFYKSRPVPYAMKKKVETELERLTKQGIIEPVKFSEWAAPIVPVLKPDDTVRICGDYKLTVNQVSKLEQYPIPKLEDLFEKLSGGEKFSKLDLSHAYQQVVLDEGSKSYVTLNTHKGLFQVNRLPFGVSSSPAIFQRIMEGLVAGIPNVAVYLDDILLTGRNNREHLETLNEVLRRLREAGLQVKRSKCAFMDKEAEFLGYKVDASGLHPLPNKVKAIQQVPAPTNVTELKAYLGLLNYYKESPRRKFLPNLSTLLAPLHKLLRKETVWTWQEEQDRAFEQSKELMQSSEVLVHYDSHKDLILSCDASPYGLGAVLAHRMPDGQERPIGFMSRTLTPAESNYSQLDKEGLAVIFGIKRFHKYLYGRKFIVCTDHKPLLSLFNEMKAVPQMVSPRIQRWAVTLRAYEYEIVYKPGKHHSNVDVLSRLPLPGHPKEEETEDRVLMMEDITLVSARELSGWTRKDPVLSRVFQLVQQGWATQQTDPVFQPYVVRKTELSVQDGCVLWGARVIIPPPGRSALLQQLHQGHVGITRMKALARSYFWWPKWDHDIDVAVKECNTCQQHRNSPVAAPLHPWEWPSKPWQRLHIDYAGPFMGSMFLIIMDAHSKWMDAYPVKTATSTTTIECLRKSFSSQGLPETIVSDNASCFMSVEFKDFLGKNGIVHVTSAPYHAASNGCAERAVQTFKSMMKKAGEGSMAAKVSRVLFNYRITPQSTTGLSPAEMLQGRRLRSTLDLVHPNLRAKVERKQWRQKEHHDRRWRERSFHVGDAVMTRNFSYGPKWIPGFVAKSTGPLSYKVMLNGGFLVRRHVDQILRSEQKKDFMELQASEIPLVSGEVLAAAGGSPILVPEKDSMDSKGEVPEGPTFSGMDTPVPEVVNVTPESPSVVPLRRSKRVLFKPSYLKDYKC